MVGYTMYFVTHA